MREEDFTFMMYCAEQEGLLDTTESLMQRFLQTLSIKTNPQDPAVYYSVAAEIGLDLDSLRGNQLKYLAEEIQKM